MKRPDPPAGYRELAQPVEELLVGGGALVPAPDVQEEVAHRLRHLTLGALGELADPSEIARLARAIAAYLGQRHAGCVICGSCGLQLMAADGAPTRLPPAAIGVRTFDCPCGARYAVTVGGLQAMQRSARHDRDQVIRLGPEDAVQRNGADGTGA